MDLEAICWGPDTYDIWVESGDVGTYCYKYIDNNWVRYWMEKVSNTQVVLHLDKLYKSESELNKYQDEIQVEIKDLPKEIIDKVKTYPIL